jgi:3-dehydro-L-gulonate 2-dehydrogenase
VAAILSEGLATHGIDQVQRGSCTGCSQIFIVLDPDRLGSAAHMREVVEGVVAYVNGSTPVKPGRQVTVPGQNTIATREDHEANGVVVDDEIWAEVRRLADG